MSKALVLSYAGCSTCKKALKWLEARGVDVTVRPIVDEPPTRQELAAWIPASGLPLQKWLNTSGQSYRAIGKDKVAAASEDTIRGWLAADGKLVKRPVLVRGKTVLVGFDEKAYAALFG
ncbi:MAG TPA: Spx/MgsR family RNA polymerase-binding regulatory protein [Polyangiaceae bacterium]|jgi:arsenate reductase|nr:Spx/MgsR family RNA polymerase-binding regulatory protein [Polyangiaceae bacterium]